MNSETTRMGVRKLEILSVENNLEVVIDYRAIVIDYNWFVKWYIWLKLETQHYETVRY
jgi:hypothetical protein